jgi:hypothetical protein
MTQARSYAALVAEWENLLGGLAGQPSLAGLTNQPKLEAALANMKALIIKQSELLGAKQTVSQEIFGAASDGRDIARDLKVEIKSRLGSRAEQLVQFKVKPLRTNPPKVRASKRKSKGKAGNTTPSTPSTAPETSNPPKSA